MASKRFDTDHISIWLLQLIIDFLEWIFVISIMLVLLVKDMVSLNLFHVFSDLI